MMILTVLMQSLSTGFSVRSKCSVIRSGAKPYYLKVFLSVYLFVCDEVSVCVIGLRNLVVLSCSLGFVSVCVILGWGGGGGSSS